MAASADRNLLFGILALQTEFISREELVEAMHAWVLDKSQSLGAILERRAVITSEVHRLVDSMVQLHVKQHDGDARSCLKSVSTVAPLCQDVDEPGDLDLTSRLLASLTHEDVRRQDVLASTLGVPTSRGLRFRILRPHRQGGLGLVSVAYDRELNREVALKEIQSHLADNPESRQRFVQEAEVTGRLEHPGIVPVYGLGHETNGRPFYAMRFVRGVSLKQAIDQFHQSAEDDKRFDGSSTVEFHKLLGRFVDVCNAVEYAHSRGVLHRDLKPDNIMLGNYGETLVVDWGLAKPEGAAPSSPDSSADPIVASSSSTETMPGSAVGTPQYMSPEQAIGQSLGKRSDVYSLGCTLYSLLTGRTPFTGTDPADVLEKVKQGTYPAPRRINANVPPPLEAVCLKSMALDSLQRYASARELADEIDRWLADEPVLAFPEPWRVRAGRWVRRHRALVSSGAAAMAVAFVLLAVGLALVDGARRRSEHAEHAEAEARGLAQQRFHQARAAVDDFLTAVAEDPELRNSPRSHPLRRRLLERAKSYYQGFLDEAGREPDDPQLRAAAAAAYGRLASITQILSPGSDANDLYQQRIALYERLVREHPQVAGYANQLAVAQLELGGAQAATGAYSTALQSYAKALVLLQRLVDDHPAVADYRHNLGRALNSQGVSQELTDQLQPAENSYRRSVELLQRLTRDHPTVATYRVSLAKTFICQGVLQETTKQLAPAEQSYDSAIACLEVPLEQAPRHADHRNILGMVYSNLGILRRATGKLELAGEAYNEAVIIRGKLVEDYPDVPEYRNELAKVLVNRGVLLGRMGKLNEAAESYQQAASLRDELVQRHPEIHGYRRGLAIAVEGLAIVQQEMHELEKANESMQRAVELARTLVKDFPEVVDYHDGLGIAYKNLGAIGLSLGDVESAAALLKSSVEKLAPLVNDYPDRRIYRHHLARALHFLGKAFHEQNNTAAADDSYQQAIDHFETLTRLVGQVPQYQNDLAGVYLSLGISRGTAGTIAEARKSYREATAIREALVRDYPADFEFRTDLARTYHDFGVLEQKGHHHEEAINWYERGIEVLRPLEPMMPALAPLRLQLEQGVSASRAAMSDQD